jgi:hypothetical protein
MRSYLEEQLAAPVYKTENTAVRIRRADHATQNLALTSPTGGGRSVGIIRLRNQARELVVNEGTETMCRSRYV